MDLLLSVFIISRQGVGGVEGHRDFGVVFISSEGEEYLHLISIYQYPRRKKNDDKKDLLKSSNCRAKKKKKDCALGL